MNIFSTPLFLETAGSLFFPQRRRSIETFLLENRVLRLLVLDGTTVVRTMPFYDYPQPLDARPDDPLQPLAYFPRTVVQTTTIDARVPEAPGFQPSPYIDWSAVSDWATFEKQVATKSKAKPNDSQRQRRRLEKDLGPVSFVYDDQRPEVFAACAKWKSGQYLASGYEDGFAKFENLELFRQLHQQKALVVSSLSAGSTLLAAHFGSFNDGRLSWWIPSYDPAFSKYSPGRLMLELLIQESHRLGHKEFDFLIGDEAYKYTYATHNRVIGPLGTPPLRERVLARAKKEAKAILTKYPRAYDLARELKRRLR